MAVKVELTRIFIREMTDLQVIELTECGGTRSFPIVIGLPEAAAIERRLSHIPVPRPQTHELLESAITALGGELEQVEINALEGGTFIATLVVSCAGAVVRIDSRPSDAIALVAGSAVPIWVAEEVMASAVQPEAIILPASVLDDDEEELEDLAGPESDEEDEPGGGDRDDDEAGADDEEDDEEDEDEEPDEDED